MGQASEMKVNACIRVSIAGFDFVISPLDAVQQQKAQNLKAFFSKEKHGINLRVFSDGEIPDMPIDTRVFSSGSHWQLYRLNRDYCFKITSSEKNKEFISRLAVFPSDFSSSKIYTYSPVGDKGFPLEYPLDQILLIHLSALNKGVLFHACGVVLEKQGLIFVGHSGAGKSTIGGLFSEYKQSLILSDDRIVVKKEGSDFWIHGTPWYGSLGLCSPSKARLKKIFFLKKSDKNSITPLSTCESVKRLTSFSFLPYWEKTHLIKTLSTINSIASSKNLCYELSFKPDKDIVGLVEDVL